MARRLEKLLNGPDHAPTNEARCEPGVDEAVAGTEPSARRRLDPSHDSDIGRIDVVPRCLRSASTIGASARAYAKVLPTLAELAGASIPTERNGVPLRPIAGQNFASSFTRPGWRRDNPLWFEHEDNRALRDGSWQLVSRHSGDWELYNVEDDRTETSNVAATEPARVNRIAAIWDSTALAAGVRADLSRVWDGVAAFQRRSAATVKETFAQSPTS
jgi:hypothetical protein